MPYFKSSEEWLEQSVLLLEARPSTTRITTRFSIKPVEPRKKAAGEDATAASSDDASEPKPPRGSLVIKTYDPVSGVTLKYRTTKAAEVSRLIYTSLGKLGRGMAGVPDVPEEPMADAATEGQAGTEQKSEGASQSQSQQPQQQQPQQSGGAGGKKKKKGKK